MGLALKVYIIFNSGLISSEKIVFYPVPDIYSVFRMMRILKFLERWRFPIPFVYSDDYWMLDVGQHVFPIKKYRALYERLLLLGDRKTDFLAPEPASDEDILLVHSARYVKKLKTASLSSAEIAMIELPFSMELVHFAWLMTGGTILTARLARRFITVSATPRAPSGRWPGRVSGRGRGGG